MLVVTEAGEQPGGSKGWRAQAHRLALSRRAYLHRASAWVKAEAGLERSRHLVGHRGAEEGGSRGPSLSTAGS